MSHKDIYMNTQQFADLIVETLDEQGTFKDGETYHPGDICIAFSMASETIGAALSWAISQQHKANKQEKQGLMQAMNLKKVALPDDPEYPRT